MDLLGKEGIHVGEGGEVVCAHDGVVVVLNVLDAHGKEGAQGVVAVGEGGHQGAEGVQQRQDGGVEDDLVEGRGVVAQGEHHGIVVVVEEGEEGVALVVGWVVRHGGQRCRWSVRNYKNQSSCPLKMAKSLWDAKLNFNEILFWQILLIIVALALIASFFTNTGLYSPWYNNLPQASWYPPTWLFVFAWTFLYLLIAFTGYIGVRLDPYRYGFLALLALGIFVNVLWCLAFFTLESATWGFGLIVLLDAIVLAQVLYLLVLGTRVRSNAMIASGALLLLYLAWGLYATTLNGFILFS